MALGQGPPLAINQAFCHGRSMDQRKAVEARMGELLSATQFPILGPMVQTHLGTGGKRLRARLALDASLALGCTDDAVRIAWAAACELMHNATLIHDDVQDGDTLRRGAPTLWVRHGMAQAINAGDLMLMAPFAALAEPTLPPALGFALSQALSGALLQVIEGQAEECAMTAEGDGDLITYTRMIRGKTSALFALPVQGAALLAGVRAEAAHTLAQAFMPLGELFQLQDDVLDLYGEKGRDVIGSDLYEGKISALVVHHLAQHPQDRPWLSALLKRPRAETTEAHVREASDRFIASGALLSVFTTMDTLIASAQNDVDPKLAPLMATLLQDVMTPIAPIDPRRRRGGTP